MKTLESISDSSAEVGKDFDEIKDLAKGNESQKSKTAKEQNDSHETPTQTMAEELDLQALEELVPVEVGTGNTQKKDPCPVES